MRKQCQKLISTRRSGFTIVESLVSLVVVAMAAALIAVFSSLLLRDMHHHDETINFHLYLNELENHNYQLMQCQPDRITLIDHQTGRKYRIKHFKNLVIMTGLKSGYVPLLKNVESTDWTYHDHVLNSHLVMTNQQKFNAKSWLKKCSKKAR